jgi:lipopolysaccharide biosynthesis regulator YciM
VKVRTFVSIISVLVAVFGVAAMAHRNRELVRQQFLLWDGTTLTVGWMLLLCFLAGAVFVFGALSIREVERLTESWRRRRETLQSEEIEDEYARGLVAELEGRPEEALAHFRAVLERDSRHFNTLLKIGDVLRREGKHAQAIEFHRKAEHLREDDTRPLYALVEDHEAEGDMERARTVVARILAVNRSSVAAWRKLRDLHVKESHWTEALEAQRRVDKLGGAPPEGRDARVGTGIRYQIAIGRLVEGGAREAVAQMRRLVREHPAFIPAHLGLGRALIEDGQENAGIEAWHEGFERTGSPIFLMALEEHFLEREQPLGGIEALKRCIARSRKDTLARFFLGKLYFRLEMLDDALAVLTSLEGRATYAPTLHYLIGRIHERRRNFEAAAREYRRVVKERDLVEVAFSCRSCGATRTEWADRCGRCGEWNTVEIDFREEIPLDELGIAPAPIYTTGD